MRSPPHPSQLTNSGSPGVFFETACANLLLVRQPSAGLESKTVAVSVAGEHGGRWLLDFSRARVARSEAPADLSIAIDRESFDLLMKRELGVDAALRDRRVLVEGDRTLLKHLADLFVVPAAAGEG